MFTWVCPKCGREVPPAYDECPDCAGKAATEAVPGAVPPPHAAAPPQQSQPAAPAPGPRGARRPLWATGAQEPLPPAPPPSFVPPPPPPPPPAAAAPPVEPPPSRPPKPVTSPLFQPVPEPAQYTVPSPAGPPKWLLGVAAAVIIIIVGGGLYWFFGRPQTTSAVIENPAAAQPAAAGENPLQKYIEITGVRFTSIARGVGVKFVIVNHSDSDLPSLEGTATIFAKTDAGQQTEVGTVKFQTAMPAQGSQELTLPLDTKMKLVDMPDWQFTAVKVQITSPSAA